MSVIDSLSAGYRFLGRRLELLLIPILLDLLFWLGPRLSISPLFQQLADFYRQAASMDGMPVEMAEMSQQMATTLLALGEQTNLFGVLANTSMLHVPTLLAVNTLGLDRQVLVIQNPGVAAMLFIGFSLIGVLIGVIYLNMLTRNLPLGDAPKPHNFGSFVMMALRHWVMVLLYVALMFIVLLVGSIPITLAVSLLSLISPAIGSLIFMVIAGTLLVLFFYLYFVVAAMIIDNLPVHKAIRQSFSVVRNNFWATLGFVVLCNVIMLGFTFIMASLAGMTAFGTLAAILIYAYIGSGLAMALFVFYRTRLIKNEGEFGELA